MSKHQQLLEGVVVSDKMHKTVVVEVARFAAHPRYGKRIRILKRFKAHDEENAHKVGDEVVIEATRPISKEKRWKIVKRMSNDKAQITNQIQSSNVKNFDM